MPADGGTSLVEPLVGKLRELGVGIKMGHAVTHVEREADGWRVHWRPEQAGSAEQPASFPARKLILATDAANTQKILCASPDTSAIAADLYWPRAMPTAVMRLWFDRSPLTFAEAGIFSGEFVLDNYFWLDFLQDSYIEWHKATGGSAVEVHLYGPPALLDEPDAVLLARAAADVNSAFPELRGHLIHQTLRRNDATHTLFGLGPAERHLGIETPWPDLFCCGDWVRHPTPTFFLERACVTGIEAANEVLKSRHLSTWPLLDPPAPERFAGWIERLMLWGRRVRQRWRRNET
jgi:isorenieratene synthase